MTGLTILLLLLVVGIVATRMLLHRGVRETAVEVFVDDAVRGWLPLVCAKSGAPADGRLPINVYSQRFNPLWLLLILLGPLGWLVLIGVAVFGARGEVLVVRMPMTNAVMERYVAARRRLNRFLILFVIGVPVALAALVMSSRAVAAETTSSGPNYLGLIAAGLVAIAALVALIQSAVQAARTRFVIELDASRRWVTIDGVCPEFAAAATAATRDIAMPL